MYLSQDEVNEARNNHDDLDIIKRAKKWSIMIPRDCEDMRRLRRELQRANIAIPEFCLTIAFAYKQISDAIIHALEQITADDFLPEGIVHFTKYENELIEKLMEL